MNRLGNLPLAIEQARAYIGTTSIQLRQYLQLYDKNAKALLELPPAFSNYRRETVLTTSEISFTKIQETDPRAAKVLLHSGFLAKNDLFIELFQWGLETQGQTKQEWEESIRDAIRKLRSFSLIKQRTPMDSFSVHPMIQLWIQVRPLTPRENLAKETAYLLDRTRRIDRERRFEWRLVPHLDAVFAGVQNYYYTETQTTQTMLKIPPSISPYPSASIDYIEGWYLRSRAGVESLWYTIVGALQGSDFVRPLWHTMYLLGPIYRDTCSHESTEALYRWVLTAAWSSLPKRHPAALTIVGDLAWSLFLQRRLDESMMWYEWTLAARKHVLGPSHPATMGALMGIANIYDLIGRHEEALKLLKKVYNARLKRLGKHDWLTLNAVENLAISLEREGNPEAIEWRIRHYNWSRGRADHDPGDSTDALIDIADKLIRNNRQEEAKTWLTSLPPHSVVSEYDRLEDTLGSIIMACNTVEESLQWYNQLLEHCTVTSNPDLCYIRSQYLLAISLRNARHFEDSIEWSLQALSASDFCAKTLNESCIIYQNIMRYTIAKNSKDLERHDEALQQYVQTISWIKSIQRQRGFFSDCGTDLEYDLERNRILCVEDIAVVLLRIGMSLEAFEYYYYTIEVVDCQLWIYPFGLIEEFKDIGMLEQAGRIRDICCHGTPWPCRPSPLVRKWYQSSLGGECQELYHIYPTGET